MRRKLHSLYRKANRVGFRLELAIKFMIARFLFILSDKHDKEVILFGEKEGLEARDNAFTLFSSLYESGRRDVYYLMSRRCRDKTELGKFGDNIIRYNSLRHMRYIFRARLLVVNDGYRDVYPKVSQILWHTDAPFLYVQHGIIRYKRVYFTAGHYWGRLIRFVISTDFESEIMVNRMFTSANDRERVDLDFVRTLMGEKQPLDSRSALLKFSGLTKAAAKNSKNPDFAQRLQKYASLADRLAKRAGMPEARLIKSGLPRHDRLYNAKNDERSREIVIFLTWRENLSFNVKAKSFPERLIELLTDNKLREVARLHGLTFKVYLHHLQRQFSADLKRRLPDYVVFSDSGDISREVTTAAALITDYSSVAFDFCLAGCPVLFYHPDMQLFQAERGDYTRSHADWIGVISKTPKELAEALSASLANGGSTEHQKKLLSSYPNWGRALPQLTKAIEEIPPRVVFVVYNIYGTGGTVRTVTNFANYLFEKGYHVEVISLRRTKVNPDMGLHHAIRVYSLLDHTRPATLFERLLKGRRSRLVHKDSDLYEQINLLMDIRLISRLRQVTADIVIPTFPGLVPICNRFSRRKTKVLAMEHQYYAAHKPSIQKLIRQEYPKADGLTVLSDKDVRDQSKFSQCVYKLPNGVVPPAAFAPGKARIPRIVALGRFARWKRFDILIDAFAMLKDEFPGWELHLFGDGEVKQELIQQVSRLGLSSLVKMRGITTKSVWEIGHGEICAVPSEHEPFGMVLIEAFAAGRPVVAFDVETGPKEIIDDGVTGLKAKPLNVADFADKLRVLMSSPELREKMGRAAYALYEEKYSINAVGAQFEAILEDIMDNGLGKDTEDLLPIEKMAAE